MSSSHLVFVPVSCSCPGNNAAICFSHPKLPGRKCYIPCRPFPAPVIHWPAGCTCLPINQLESDPSYLNIPRLLRKPNKAFPPRSCNFQTENWEEEKQGALKWNLSPPGQALSLRTSHSAWERSPVSHAAGESAFHRAFLNPTLSWSLSLYPVTAPYCKGDTTFHKTCSRLIDHQWIRWKFPNTVTKLSYLWLHALGILLQTSPSISLCLSRKTLTFPCTSLHVFHRW